MIHYVAMADIAFFCFEIIMLRYCTECHKDFDFPPLAVSGREDLICPECGSLIDKNSRNPAGKETAERTEENIGNAYARLLHLSYIFYLTISILGIISWFAGLHGVLYVLTIISLTAFILQLITGTLIFRLGLILLPAGAVIGYMVFGLVDGACLGIHLVFFIQHLIRDIIYGLVFRFIQWTSGC